MPDAMHTRTQYAFMAWCSKHRDNFTFTLPEVPIQTNGYYYPTDYSYFYFNNSDYDLDRTRDILSIRPLR